MQSPTTDFDRVQARDWLALLDPAPDARHAFRTADDSPTKDPRNAVKAYGTLGRGIRQHRDPAKDGRPCCPAGLLSFMQQHGAGAFAMVHATDGLGQLKANVTRGRALFLDFDDPVSLARREHFLLATGLLPTMTVESGGLASDVPKLHVYFRVRDLAADAVAAAQRVLASQAGTDFAVCDPARIMRIAGSWHLKAAPRQVRIIEAHDVEYELADVLERVTRLPIVAAAPVAIRRRGGTGHSLDLAAPTARLRHHLDRFGGLITPAVRAVISEARAPDDAGGGNRHATLVAIVARLAQVGWRDQDIRDLVLPAVLEAWTVADDLEARVANVIAWVRSREAVAHAVPMSDRARRLSAVFSGRSTA